jgi:aldose 1-epimerase
MTSQHFGTLADGNRVDLFILTNSRGTEVRIMNYGGTIVSCRTADRDGRLEDIVLGFDSLDDYLERSRYFGCIVGRYANRIAAGKFALNGKTYTLATNNGPNHLHGGTRGFDKFAWAAEGFEDQHGSGVRLTRTSPDGEEGYPGKLDVTVTYTLNDSNALTIEYGAVTDAPTPVNLTNHSYFNLKGAGAGDILDHHLTLHASAYTPTSSTLIPTGEIASVERTPFDFRRETAIGSRIDADHVQLRHAGGYDHNFVVDGSAADLRPAADVWEPTSGRTLAVSTTQPGIQFYSGNFLTGTLKGKGGRVYAKRGGLCLETQHFPDSPNQPKFPTTILKPGERCASSTVFTFGVR